MSFSVYLNELINKNHQSFKQYPGLRWMNPYQAIDLETQRNETLASFTEEVQWAFKKTKPYINSISRGCQLCGEGEWSCLFITGLCNANCFYCPTTQQADHLPTTQQFNFEKAGDYADYINKMKFKGVSFSGGEPLLFFDRLVEYVRTIRQNCAPDIYIWMYTNGKLLTKEKAEILSEMGIDEIRFDIGATDYKFDTIQFAQGKIPHITVEIPAVPEKTERIKSLLPELIKCGVTNLNLHQMRLTSHNVSKLEKHNYTYLHGEAPVVAQSELSALEIIQHVDQHKIPLGVNYCGFQYKNRFQKSGYRKKLAHMLADNQVWITEAGYLGEISGVVNEESESITRESFLRESDRFTSVLIRFSGIMLELVFGLGYDLTFGDNHYKITRKAALKTIEIPQEDFPELIKIFVGESTEAPECEDLFNVWRHVQIESGMRDYQ